jgi:hypothetical protein
MKQNQVGTGIILDSGVFLTAKAQGAQRKQMDYGAGLQTD